LVDRQVLDHLAYYVVVVANKYSSEDFRVAVLRFELYFDLK